MRQLRIIILKEWADTLRNKMLASVLIGVPLLMMAIPSVMLYVMKVSPINQSDLQDMGKLLANPLFAGMDSRAALQAGMASQFMVMFLMMPLFIPVTFAAYSIVGEKVARTLEPLLATPISTAQLLAGKSLSAVIPAVVVTWISYGLFLVFARLFAVSDRVFSVFVDPMWLVAMFLLAPLLTVMSVNIGIMISSRTTDPRAAEQLGGLVVLPVVLLMVGGISGFVYLSSLLFLLCAAVVALVDVGLVYAGVALFRRETILTRWK